MPGSRFCTKFPKDSEGFSDLVGKKLLDFLSISIRHPIDTLSLVFFEKNLREAQGSCLVSSFEKEKDHFSGSGSFFSDSTGLFPLNKTGLFSLYA